MMMLTTEVLADLCDQLRHLLQLRGDHAGDRLVEQQDLRIGHQRTRDLQTALIAVGQVLRQQIRLVGHVPGGLAGS